MRAVRGEEGERGRRLAHFSPRARSRRVSASYSRFVGLMKYLLPLVALAIIALVALWPELHEEPGPAIAPRTGQEAGQMLSPRFVSVDNARQPYSIVARAASQSPVAPSVVDLDRPEAELTRSDGTWLALIADRGSYDREAERIDLQGRVNLFRDDGSELLTDRAQVDLKAGVAWGDLPVQAQGPFGLLTAEGFRFADEGRTVVFLGQSSLLLRQDRDRGRDSGEEPVQGRDPVPEGNRPQPPQDQAGTAGRVPGRAR